jgi:rhamnosyltransferase
MLKVSVIIPVKNGATTLDKCLESIKAQSSVEIEIIILDSNSTDTSIQIAKDYGAIIYTIQEGSFNHGLTRNFGFEKASGELLYFTVQDAWLSENWILEKMISHFDDENVMAVCGHQAIPWGHLDKNPAYWFKRYSKPEVEKRYFPVIGSFAALPVKIQFEKSSWDDVNAMYRKSALEKINFRNTNYSEDWLWANDALKNGMMLLRDPKLVTYHYHHMTFNYVYKTSFIVYYNFLIHFNHKQKILFSPNNFIRACYTIVKRKQLTFSKKFYWMFHNLGISFGFFVSSFRFNLMTTNKKKKHFLRLSKQLPQGLQNN